MADVKPLRALQYNQRQVGSLESVTAPPYDVIDSEQREALVAGSPYNVVNIDLPQGKDRYEHAGRLFDEWRRQGVLVRDDEPAYWALTQKYSAPDGKTHTRHGIFGRVRVTEYGAGRIRPHERTHAKPKQDRLKLTRTTRANLSPIFSLYSDPEGRIWQPATASTSQDPWGEVEDGDGTLHRVWRISDSAAIDEIGRLLDDKELLIADGHHRYETAYEYSRETGGEGDHNYTLMCLVAMEDPGLTVLPTHRLIKGLDEDDLARVEEALTEHFSAKEVPLDKSAPAAAGEGEVTRFGYVSANGKPPRILSLDSTHLVDEALKSHSDAYRRLDTAVLEELVLKEALKLSQEELADNGKIWFVKDADEARRMVQQGLFQGAFLLRATPISQITQVAGAGETMPPKSTYFHPKLLTGLVLSPLA